jgi:RNA polymerase sigma-70 factor (ECF subfamily)
VQRALAAIADPSPDRPSDGREPLDQITLVRAQRGDKAAFRRLVQRHERPVFALLSRMLTPSGRQSMVEDLAQETFVRVYRGLPEFGSDGRNNLMAWILTIATRLALDELRKRPLGTESLDRTELLPATDRTDEGVERKALRDALERAVLSLPPTFRAAFLLREVHELEYEEIATALSIDLGTVKSRLHRARAALREALQGIEHE